MVKPCNFFKKEWVQVNLLLILFLILVNTPLVIRILQTPPGKAYFGAEKFFMDYYYYLGVMTHGANGGWGMIDPETGKEVVRFVYHPDYILMGKAAKLLHVPNPVFYHAARITVQALLFLAFYKLTFLVGLKRTSRVVALVVVFFLAAPPLISNFYRPFDNISLYTQNPHFEISLLGGLVSLAFFIKYFETKTPKNYLLLILALVLTSFMYPPHSVLVALAIFFTLIFLVMSNWGRNLLGIGSLNKAKLFRSVCFILLLAWVVLLPPIFYKTSYAAIPLLKQLTVDFEGVFAKTDFGVPFLPLLASFVYYLSPFALLCLGIKKSFSNLSNIQKLVCLVCLGYLLSFVFLFFVGFYFLGVSRARFSSSLWPVAFAILVGLSYNHVEAVLKRFLSHKATFILVVFLFLFSLPSYYQSIIKDSISPSNDYIYPLKELSGAVSWMRHLPAYSKVVSTEYSGMYFMGLGGVLPYLDSVWYTPDYSNKKLNVEWFFGGRGSEEQARKFLNDYQIKYVFFGPFEVQNPYFDVAAYPFLKKIYQNSRVRIFEFIP